MKAQQPDFTGVWTNYVEPGQGRGGGAATAGGGRGGAADLPMTAEGRQKVQAYQALIKGTGDTPGGFCLGTGMPGSMLGSGGYPMEIIQRSNQITITGDVARPGSYQVSSVGGLFNALYLSTAR